MRVVLVFTGLGLVVSGCATAAPMAVAPDPGLLAGVTLSGGLCPDGVCASGFEVRADGTWIATSGSTTTRGALPAPVLAAMQQAAATTGIASAPPFTGTCPNAYDGSEAVYTWRTPEGVEVTVSACERAVNASDPLVVALAVAQDAAEGATDDAEGTTDAE